MKEDIDIIINFLDHLQFQENTKIEFQEKKIIDAWNAIKNIRQKNEHTERYTKFRQRPYNTRKYICLFFVFFIIVISTVEMRIKIDKADYKMRCLNNLSIDNVLKSEYTISLIQINMKELIEISCQNTDQILLVVDKVERELSNRINSDYMYHVWENLFYLYTILLGIKKIVLLIVIIIINYQIMISFMHILLLLMYIN